MPKGAPELGYLITNKIQSETDHSGNIRIPNIEKYTQEIINGELIFTKKQYDPNIYH